MGKKIPFWVKTGIVGLIWGICSIISAMGHNPLDMNFLNKVIFLPAVSSALFIELIGGEGLHILIVSPLFGLLIGILIGYSIDKYKK